MELYLYDPRTNVLTETNYQYLEQLTGKSRNALATAKSRGTKIRNINSYFVDESITLRQRKEWYDKEKYENEVWKVIRGSGNKYLVSNYGRFKRVYPNKEKLLLPFLKKRKGFLEIRLMFDGKREVYRVANLVAIHFIGSPKPNEVLRHKNGIKTDNFSGNLEYLTKEKLGKMTGRLAKSMPVVQLNKDTLEFINEFRSVREAGRECYLSYQAVLDNCRQKSKTSGGYVFMFADEYEEKIQLM